MIINQSNITKQCLSLLSYKYITSFNVQLVKQQQPQHSISTIIIKNLQKKIIIVLI